MGEMLAKMHNAVEDFPFSQENTKGSAFWLSSMPLLKPYIPERLYQMLEEEVTRQLELQKSRNTKPFLPAPFTQTCSAIML